MNDQMDTVTGEVQVQEPANTTQVLASPGTQSVLPGSVSESDLDKVFSSFVEWVGWDDPTCIPASHKKLEKRAELLRPRRDRIAKKLARVQGILDQIQAELRPSEEKKTEAREYLAAAVAQMGAFGSMEVLTAALKKKYHKVIIHPTARKNAKPEQPAPATGTGGKEGADEIKAGMDAVGNAAKALDTIRKVQEVLDREGMTLTEIKRLLPELDGGTVKGCLIHLTDTKVVDSTGSRGEKKYKLITPGA